MLTKLSLLCSFFLLTTFFASANTVDYQDVPKLSVSGQANLRKPADELNMTIGVTNTNSSAQEAIKENSARMQSVINALDKLGLAKSDYQTGHFSITPTYTPYPKNPPPDWRQTINGYEVNNSVQIRTDKLHLAGQIIDSTSKSGANTINNIHFALKDRREYGDEALTAATKNAIADAKVIADAAGVKLLRLLSISLNSTPSVSPRMNTYAKTYAAESAPTPIEPGDIDISADVLVIFEIGQG